MTCLAYNHDGTILASSSWDKSLRLWDPKTGRLAEGVKVSCLIRGLQARMGWALCRMWGAKHEDEQGRCRM